MSSAKPRSLLRIEYEEAAEACLRSLPPEHFMEATAQARQREITLESLALVHRARPEVQYFNELLVQYPVPDRPRPTQVVPDNMVVLWDKPIDAGGSYDVPFQPVRPFWMLEYVSKATRRKDYEDNFKKYEEELQVPYCLLFYPQVQELTLYRHNGNKYLTVTPNEQGRYPIPELELEVGLREGWVRYWFRGELLPLPAELQGALDEARRRAEAEGRRADEQARRADEEARQVEELKRQLATALRQLEEERAARLEAEQRQPRSEESP
jgi:Uma2 family endonuclease